MPPKRKDLDDFFGGGKKPKKTEEKEPAAPKTPETSLKKPQGVSASAAASGGVSTSAPTTVPRRGLQREGAIDVDSDGDGDVFDAVGLRGDVEVVDVDDEREIDNESDLNDDYVEIHPPTPARQEGGAAAAAAAVTSPSRPRVSAAPTPKPTRPVPTPSAPQTALEKLLQWPDCTEDEKLLRAFDLESKWGPGVGISREERWIRAEKLGLSPPADVWDLLQKVKAKARDTSSSFRSPMRSPSKKGPSMKDTNTHIFDQRLTAPDL
uniref:DNA polymerase delta subunit 4 n=1 Tax=Chromera velia CCMP2878 TaxID=1169474 RepID=A0A0G4GU30_9ALVE|mmetsp:Transcript_5528/g.10953  ORF Transcript_5528/g.10953 Transcript_5528/m.10953 type:complete len:265 (+) Transcript_5528:458-1252(+)|eukprot:Cvel_23381.t1-p1 / transcript=Cvel_23381.t1 / gene=Cvel_23381 / organism=Chromera_velia_CCMP2878 / gene_product=DNA polymerase delta subunit 4, putative / transcript_product=DNA polymerase delta subunit 4, putative / location=Cvel_scaffold2402:23671-26152(+) / protein_length=264 / sequence_SO=supercontig / SO=protein_coding / is_pseudo=false